MDLEKFVKISDRYVIVNSYDDMEYLAFELSDVININENYIEKYNMGYISYKFREFTKSELLTVDLILKEFIINNLTNINKITSLNLKNDCKELKIKYGKKYI